MLFSFRPHQASIAWKLALGELDRSSPVVAGKVPYVGSNNGKFFAFRSAVTELFVTRASVHLTQVGLKDVTYAI